MPLARVHVQQMIQDSQDYGSDDEHMVSRIFFDLEVDGTIHKGLFVNVKQTIGSSFEKGSIEVSRPVGYQGLWDHEAFSTFAQQYYRSLVGPGGSGIRFSGGVSIRMRNNVFIQPASFEFQVQAAGGPW